MSNDEMSTQPTIEAILERINAWGEQFKSEFAELRASVEELRKGQEDLRKGHQELRADLNAGLHRVARKIEILNDNFLTIRADNRELEVRIEKLEAESLAPK